MNAALCNLSVLTPTACVASPRSKGKISAAVRPSRNCHLVRSSFVPSRASLSTPFRKIHATASRDQRLVVFAGEGETDGAVEIITTPEGLEAALKSAGDKLVRGRPAPVEDSVHGLHVVATRVSLEMTAEMRGIP